MTFGRWLLIHSFSIFLVILFFVGYLYRDELQLEQAYQQLLNLEPKKLTAKDSNVPEDQSMQPEKAAPGSVQEISPVPLIESTPTLSKTIIQQDDLLFKARKAYWNKDYQDAINLYQQLIQDDNRNPDYRGELGNIYYALNDYPNASRQYYQAALILIDINQIERARHLVSPVTAMNRDLGNQLKRRLLR